MPATVVVSRRGLDRIRRGHPWIYRSDVVRADAEPGDIVRVRTERDRIVGWAYWSSRSQIALRMLGGDDPGTDDAVWIGERVRRAARYRAALSIDATAYRLVNGEADGLPATVVDRYGDASGGDVWFVVQTLSQGSDRRLAPLVAALVAEFRPRGVLARNDPKVRELEGLTPIVDVLHGSVPDRLVIREAAVRLHVDLRQGQKTGSFLDQRENHAAAARYTRGRALDAFTFNGGFGLQMAGRAERVLALDASAGAVAMTIENARLNGTTNVEVREANVFDELRELESNGESFDTIVLDPPAFARNRAAVERAIAGYKEINLRAMRLLAPGGHLITCSCSYNVGEKLFLDVLKDAAADAGRTMVLVEKRMQSRDHPVLLNVPETYYLKCMVLRRADDPDTR